MKNRAIAFSAVILAILMMLPILTACNKSDKTEITVEVDGEQIVLDNTEGKTIAQLLEDAEIVLNEGDVLAIDPDQNTDGSLTVKVLRRCSVLVEVEGEDLHYTVVLVGGTVADAINAAGITLADNQKANFELDKALENGMSIVISVVEPEDDGNNTAAASSNYSGSRGSSPTPSPAPSSAPSAAPSPAPSTAPGRTLVSTDDYPDPDGSGHGVRVYTYSDGSQEEVAY